ncbi:MAG: hypothetical protein ACYC6G_02960 [Desulfobaccales bacterium]
MSLPQGYRQGLITGITVFISFSLVFLRFWGFETHGKWTFASITMAVVIASSLVLQIIALFRALSLKDDAEDQYSITVRLFMLGVTFFFLGLVASMILYGISAE